MAEEKPTETAENAAHTEQQAGPDRGAEEAVASAENAASGTLAEALAQLETYKDQALRAQAEAENTRRRASRDVENAHKYALENFAQELLPVLDSLEKAVELGAESDGAAAITQGVELCLKMFQGVLEKAGIAQVDPLGEPFDPQLHEAMAMVQSPNAEPNSVIEVMQKGYTLNGRLVRAAKVIVSRAPEAGAEKD